MTAHLCFHVDDLLDYLDENKLDIFSVDNLTESRDLRIYCGKCKETFELSLETYDPSKNLE